MQRRCRVIRREQWVTKGVQELEAGDGHTEFAAQGQLDCMEDNYRASRTWVGVAVRRLPGMVGISRGVPAKGTNIHLSDSESLTRLGENPQAPKSQQQKPLLDYKDTNSR